jgi:hypothetical protein
VVAAVDWEGGVAIVAARVAAIAAIAILGFQIGAEASTRKSPPLASAKPTHSPATKVDQPPTPVVTVTDVRPDKAKAKQKASIKKKPSSSKAKHPARRKAAHRHHPKAKHRKDRKHRQHRSPAPRPAAPVVVSAPKTPAPVYRPPAPKAPAPAAAPVYRPAPVSTRHQAARPKPKAPSFTASP